MIVIKLKNYINNVIQKYKFNYQLYTCKSLPRYEKFDIKLFGRKITVPDNDSFIFLYNEIFIKEIYKFSSKTSKPNIIDCGCNIGLSIIYFKSIYPDSHIIGFEPDQEIFSILENNIKSFDLKNTIIINKALWNDDTYLDFSSEGADAGRLAIDASDKNIVNVNTTRLSPYLENEIDLLKIDIEGAEYTVLNDCKNGLRNVSRIFVEYHSFDGKEQYLPELLELLKQSGFRLFINCPGLTSNNPFLKINKYSRMDMQLNIYGYRI